MIWRLIALLVVLVSVSYMLASIYDALVWVMS